MLSCSNYDLENVVTPVDVDRFEYLLKQTDYDKSETEYLVNGFRNGFSLEYYGKRNVVRTAENLKLRVGNPIELWNKVMLEVGKGCYAGPYKDYPPFEYYIQSPIGLVPKDKGTKTRLIFHLSYPKTGESVNSQIPKEMCTVQYPTFDEAVRMCIQAGVGCKMGKSDMSAAFRNVGMTKTEWPLLVMMAVHPITGVKYFFIDKCMPFGSSISCSIFQRFSNAVAHIVKCRTIPPRKPLNYLDDFFFAALKKLVCDQQLRTFLEVCREINFPVALEKTCWGSTLMTFLGLLLDSERQMICIPIEKVQKAVGLIDDFLGRNKVKLVELQKLCGFLNFLCKCVVLGRVFLRRLYAATETKGGKIKPHHHIKIKQENKLDLMIWKGFLLHPSAVNRNFLDLEVWSAENVDLFSDASKNPNLGFGAYCGTEWTAGRWNKSFMLAEDPSIEFLELFAVAVGILNWIKLFQNKRIALFCDNEAVVHMINNTASKCPRCMVLLRLITLEGMVNNIKISARHVGTKANGKADALSRCDFKRFRKLDPNMNDQATKIPDAIWPIEEKVWCKL